MNAEHHRYAIRAIHARTPTFQFVSNSRFRAKNGAFPEEKHKNVAGTQRAQVFQRG
jgi:2-iminoacetate synthase ThiH